MNRICAHIAIGCVSLIASACVSVREPFPDVKLFKLGESMALEQATAFEGSLLVRPAYINAEYDTEYFVLREGNALTREYYLRWSAPLSDLVAQQVALSVEQMELFSEGANPESSLDLPEYALEIEVLELAAIPVEQDMFEARIVMAFRCFDLRDPVNKQVLFRHESECQVPLEYALDNFPAAVSGCIDAMVLEAFQHHLKR